MEILNDKDLDVQKYSPSVLAFIGDAVFDLIVRHDIVLKYDDLPVGKLNKIKVDNVCCQAQSKMFNIISPILTEEESNVFRRGRNAHVNQIPHNATQKEYHYATGIESLFGYLYLKGKIDRIRELISIGCNI